MILKGLLQHTISMCVSPVMFSNKFFFLRQGYPAKAAVSPCSSQLRMFRQKECLQLSNRNSALMM